LTTDRAANLEPHDPLDHIRRRRWRAFVVEFVRLRMTGHDVDGVAGKAAGFAFHGFSRPESALRKGCALLADARIVAAITSRLPARAVEA